MGCSWLVVTDSQQTIHNGCIRPFNKPNHRIYDSCSEVMILNSKKGVKKIISAIRFRLSSIICSHIIKLLKRQLPVFVFPGDMRYNFSNRDEK